MFPKAIYEALPLLYLLVGLTAMVQIEHGLGAVAGMLMVLAGVLVSYWRYDYRKLRRTA